MYRKVPDQDVCNLLSVLRGVTAVRQPSCAGVQTGLDEGRDDQLGFARQDISQLHQYISQPRGVFLISRTVSGLRQAVPPTVCLRHPRQREEAVRCMHWPYRT